MKRISVFAFSAFIVIALALSTGCGCGDDDDDSASRSSSGDDDYSDDDITDDTTGDDTADDDSVVDDTTDDTADDTSDDTSDDDTDIEYQKLTCELTGDPGGILPNLIGGGSITDTITVYVFNDLTCQPIESASVYLNDDPTPVLTDADGLATLSATDGAQKVTVLKYDGLGGGEPDFWGWSYKADAATMYFRLHPYQTGYTYTDSEAGEYLVDSTALDLTNPTAVSELFSMPFTVGVTLPGLSRSNLLIEPFAEADSYGFTFENLFTVEDFPFTVNTGTLMDVYLPANVYLPALDISILTYGASSADHQSMKVPVRDGSSVSPIEGVVAQLDVTAAVPDLAAFTDLISCIADHPGDLRPCLEVLAVPLIDEGITFPYVGVKPDWDGTGAPDLEMIDAAAKGEYFLSVVNADADLDYFALSMAEISNRALLPLGIGAVIDGTALLDYAEVPNADYLCLAGATDMLAVTPATLNFSIVARYAEKISEFAEGVAVDGTTDFLPLFDTDNTYYDGATGEVTWTLTDDSSALDVYFVAMSPANYGSEFYAVVPGTESSFLPPADLFHAGPSDSDIVFVLGFDLPEDVSINSFDPTQILAYNGAAMNLWSNLNAYDFLEEF